MTGAILVTLGCGQVDSSGESSEASRVGLSAVSVNLDDPDAWPTCTSSLETRIGEREGARGYLLFNQIEDIRYLRADRIAVLNRGSEQVRLFNLDGTYLGAFGGRGEGPGEFSDPIELELLERDSLVVWDWSTQRLSVFGPDGSFARSFFLSQPVANPTGYYETLSGDSAFVIAGGTVDNLPVGELGQRRVHLMRFDRNGEFLDTFAVLPDGHHGLADPTRGARLLFNPRASFAAHGRRLFAATGASPEVIVYSTDGSVEQVIRWTPPDRAVGQDDVAEYFEERLNALPEASRAEARRSLEAFPPPDQFPASSGILVDETGTVWVRSYQRPGSVDQTWWRFASTGAFECALALSDDFRVLEIASRWVIGVWTDDLGTEFVEIRRLILAGP